jgi:hypothetical protein
VVDEMETVEEASWPNLRHCPGICLEELRKTTKIAIRIDGLRAEI